MPLLPLWAVRSVQSPSACTTVHFTFTYTSIPPMCRTACTEPQCLYNGALYLYLYVYSPYVPYGLYRASVPVQRCTLPLPIPLLPLCAVQQVQSLSVCTNSALYLYLYLYSPYVPYSLYRASVPVLTVHCTFTYTSTPPMCRTVCTEPQCLYNGPLYLASILPELKSLQKQCHEIT